MKWKQPLGPWSLIMPKPSDMPPRSEPFERITPQAAALLDLADQAAFLMRHFKNSGFSEDTALELTLHTINRYENQYEGDYQ